MKQNCILTMSTTNKEQLKIIVLKKQDLYTENTIIMTAFSPPRRLLIILSCSLAKSFITTIAWHHLNSAGSKMMYYPNHNVFNIATVTFFNYHLWTC